MDNSIWSTIGAYACLAGILLVFATPIFLLITAFTKKRAATAKKAQAEHKAILDGGGLLAPATILSAKRIEGSDVTHTVDFEVEVQPEGRGHFRAGFRNLIHQKHYAVVGGELVGFAGQKIWIVYDPNNLSRIAYDHDDNQHEEAMLNHRRGEFNKLTEGNEELKKRGEPAEAVITRVDDLDLPYPLKQSRAKHMVFDVTPKSGSVFQAEGDVLIVDSAVEKYSVGKKVYVRFDPLNSKWAVLDTERNKSLS
ncbi:MAG: hypothetical protein U0V02_11645 [Anaerolineales bacterium]